MALLHYYEHNKTVIFIYCKIQQLADYNSTHLIYPITGKCQKRVRSFELLVYFCFGMERDLSKWD